MDVFLGVLSIISKCFPLRLWKCSCFYAVIDCAARRACECLSDQTEDMTTRWCSLLWGIFVSGHGLTARGQCGTTIAHKAENLCCSSMLFHSITFSKAQIQVLFRLKVVQYSCFYASATQTFIFYPLLFLLCMCSIQCVLQSLPDNTCRLKGSLCK